VLNHLETLAPLGIDTRDTVLEFSPGPLADLSHDLDLSVSTFHNEGFGLIHLESLAAGTPVVAYQEGGQVDILSGEEAGILVDGGIADFAAGIIALLKYHDRRFAMGK
jgi:glycosyltransferase involved in cell wall biosynthesis